MRVKLRRLIFVLSDDTKIQIKITEYVFSILGVKGSLNILLRVQDADNQIVENDEIRGKSFSCQSVNFAPFLLQNLGRRAHVHCASHFEGIQIFCCVKHVELPHLSCKISLGQVALVTQHVTTTDDSLPNFLKPRLTKEGIWRN